MDYPAKEEIRRLMQPRYRRAKKAIKQKILDEFCSLSRIFHKLSKFLMQLNFYQCKNIFA